MRLDTQVLILGPLVVERDGRALSVGGHQAKVVLAALVLGLNHAVPTDHLAWALWRGAPPPSAHDTIQSYISKLRHVLGVGAIEHEEQSYALVAEPDQVDACRFERLVRGAEELITDDPHKASELCRRALGEWRGPVLGAIGDEEFAHLEAIRLSELRLLAIELEVEAELVTGRSGEATSRLLALTEEHPFRERLWRLLVRGLVIDERRVEARAAYRRYRDALSDCGVDVVESFEEFAGRLPVHGGASSS